MLVDARDDVDEHRRLRAKKEASKFLAEHAVLDVFDASISIG